MTKLQELTAAIQKVVPEIMELKFGCKVIISSQHEDYNSIVIKNIKENYYKLDIGNEYITQEDEILGRDITLEDVLLAFEQESIKDNCDILEVNHFGQLQILTKNGYTASKEWWEIGKPLHEQSEEAIKFLHSIICQN